MQNKKIVVLTGSFNPVTKAHFQILSKAVEYLHADKGLFVATNDQYLTKKTVVEANTRTKFFLSEEVRREMLESLNKENNKLFFGGFELGGVSPATDKTLRKVIRENKGYDVYYLCGADKFKRIPHWSNFSNMIKDMHICVIEREDIDVNYIINNDPDWIPYKDKVTIFNTSDDIKDVSSTQIRNNYFNGLEYKSLMNKGPYDILSGIDPNSFRDITEEYIIECTIKYGGRFGGNAARKLVYKSNVNLFNNWNTRLLGDRDSKINGTKVYKEEFKVNSNNSYNTKFDCLNEDCVDVAYNLIREGLNPAILNLASNVHPCGGYDEGTGAQEESLCYASTLSQSLYQFGNPKKKYFKDANLTHIPNVYPMDKNYGGIYSPDVCFFRNNIDKYYTLRENPFNCSVISVASLSNRQKNEWTNDELKYFDNNSLLTKEGIEIECNKIRTIYRIALDNNHDSLVLGAFGCGVYNLNTNQVANLFKNILDEPEFKNKFKKIVFAIFEGKGSSRKVVGKEGKFKVFYDIFGV